MTLVAEAANGREVLQQCRTHHSDVTLMDLQMPEMNGLDAVIAIRTQYPDAKVIVLTIYDGDVHVLRSLKAGGSGLPGQEHGNFRHVGYPQQLRVLLGIAKLAGAIVLLLPRLPTLKEWAYAGFTITWIAATVAHYLAADGLFLVPVALLGSLGLSYVTRPADRRGFREGDLRVTPRGVDNVPAFPQTPAQGRYVS